MSCLSSLPTIVSEVTVALSKLSNNNREDQKARAKLLLQRAAAFHELKQHTLAVVDWETAVLMEPSERSDPHVLSVGGHYFVAARELAALKPNDMKRFGDKGFKR